MATQPQRDGVLHGETGFILPVNVAEIVKGRDLLNNCSGKIIFKIITEAPG